MAVTSLLARFTAFVFAVSSIPLQQQNNPPVVRILQPENNSIHARDTLVSYIVSVSDKEEGESAFDEIPAGRIFLEVKFVPDMPAPPHEAQPPLAESAGLTALKKSGCFNCHHFRDRFMAPSFAEIAVHYAQRSATGLIASRIREGSQHIWGEAIMPRHPDLSGEELRNIAAWILEAGRNENLDYLAGKEGAFRLRVPRGADRGHFRLTATFTDNGVPGKPGGVLTGRDVVILRLR